MPGYLANGHTDTLPVPGDQDGATVTFRADATLKDEMRLLKFSAALPADSDQENGQAIVTERTLLMIESWTLVDGAGDPLPLTAETLRTSLRRHVVKWLDDEATRRWEGHTKDEEGPFDTSSQPPSTVTT